MKFSIVNGKRKEPYPKGKGTCPICGNETLSKCGNRKMWHWAHCSNQMCDAWWENETEWHRTWKNYWPDENQEIVHFDDVTGEKHIADVKNSSGLVLEFQNSPINENELSSRESFYRNMIWIVNAEKFKNSIEIGAKLPNPELAESQDMCIRPVGSSPADFIFSRVSENAPDATMVEIYGSHKIQSYIENTHVGHFLFSWKRPRSVWFTSIKPVLFDFGNDVLWSLVRFNARSSFCFRAFSKSEIINLYGGHSSSIYK